MSKIGICPGCDHSSKNLQYRHPKTGAIVCHNCYEKAIEEIILERKQGARENKNQKRMGVCPNCGQGPKELNYRHPQSREPICHNCYSKIKRREKRLANPKPPKIPKPVIRKTRGRNLYPDRISVIKALEARTEEGKHNYASILFAQDAVLYRQAHRFKVELPKKETQKRRPVAAKKIKKSVKLRKPKIVASSLAATRRAGSGRTIRKKKEHPNKPGRKAKYPTRELVIAALEAREAQGKEIFPNALWEEDIPLYQAALRLGVELPKRNNPPVRYYCGDLVRNRNLKDPTVCGRIGQVILSDEKEVMVDFKEPGNVKRVYQKRYNLNNIALHARHPRNLAKITEKEEPRLEKVGVLNFGFNFYDLIFFDKNVISNNSQIES